VKRQAAAGDLYRSCGHRCPRGTEGTRSSRISCARNTETPLGSAPPSAARQADRKRGAIPGRDRMPRKRMPAAERQREASAVVPGTSAGGAA
jgi:hypothetical protein